MEPSGLPVTLYIPCYNAVGTIGHALEGVASVAREVGLQEILVIDDGSTDSSPLIVNALRQTSPVALRVVRHTSNLGLAAARNTAIANCTTPLLAGIDADVVPEKGWLGKCVAALVHWHEAAGIQGQLTEKHTTRLADFWRATHMAQHWGDSDQSEVPFLFGANHVFRVSALRAVGGYDARFRTNGEDIDISVRLRKAGWRLLYRADARCSHLKRDCVSSVIRAFWRWQYYGTEGMGLGARERAMKIPGILRIALQCLGYDLMHRNLGSLGVDMCIAPWMLLKEVHEYALEKTGRRPICPPMNLSRKATD
jgi:glycosyltransferase involved in cell wall biosynthesis